MLSSNRGTYYVMCLTTAALTIPSPLPNQTRVNDDTITTTTTTTTTTTLACAA